MGKKKQSQGRRKSAPALTDKQRLAAVKRKLRRMKLVVKHPPSWVVQRFADESLPRLLVAQTMALAVIDKVRQAAGWE